MTKLTHWVPERWRDTLANWRDAAADRVKHWLPRRRDPKGADNDHILVRYDDQNEAPEHLEFWSPTGRLARRLAIDFHETDDGVQVTANIPGLDPKNVTVEVTGRRLVIRGENKHESSRHGRGYHYQERRYNAITRAMSLPCEVDADKAQTTYNHGVLRISLPKTKRAKTHRLTLAVNE